jgi:excisionase family DNA binding protein
MTLPLNDSLREFAMSDHNEFLTTAEAAEILRTPIATLYQWRHRSEGPPAHKIGKRLLYKRVDLLEWICGQA